MNEILTYKQAAPYIRKVKRLLKSMVSMDTFIKETNKDIAEIKALAEKDGKKNALLVFTKRTGENPENDFSEYIRKLEVSLIRSQNLRSKIQNALRTIPNKTAQDVIEYYYILSNSLDDTCEKYSYSHSSVCRFKKIGLAKMAEQLFGVIIEEKNISIPLYPEDEFAGNE